MKLTVLGKNGPYPAASGATSGYLVEEKDTRILIDCGSGVLGRLQKFCSISDIDAVILSHLHSDHMSDMMVLRYALDIIVQNNLFDKNYMQVHMPASPKTEFDFISSAEKFKITVINEQNMLNLGNLSVSFKRMTHPYESYAMAISNGEKKLVYTGDTNFNNDIIDFANDADLFLADTGFMHRDLVEGKSPHLSAKQAAQIAAVAKVKKLLLTHLNPLYDEVELLEEASAYFNRSFLAEDMVAYDI